MEQYQITEHLLMLILKASRCRDAQNAYFQTKNNTNMKVAKAAEADLDRYILMLRRKGLNPGEAPGTTQTKLL